MKSKDSGEEITVQSVAGMDQLTAIAGSTLRCPVRNCRHYFSSLQKREQHLVAKHPKTEDAKVAAKSLDERMRSALQVCASSHLSPGTHLPQDDVPACDLTNVPVFSEYPHAESVPLLVRTDASVSTQTCLPGESPPKRDTSSVQRALKQKQTKIGRRVTKAKTRLKATDRSSDLVSILLV